MKNYSSSLFLSFGITLTAQTNKDYLKTDLLKTEIIQFSIGLFFNVTFNQCDLELFQKIISNDVEFYDDHSGLYNSKQIEVSSLSEKCSKSQKLTRKLNSCTIAKLGDYEPAQLGERPNTSAKYFNAKVKAFRSQFRGVRKVDFGSKHIVVGK